MPEPRFIQAHQTDSQALAAEAAAGLLAVPARVSPKFFYDALGSRLFDAITELPEYYPTRTEAAILARHGRAIADAVLGATGTAPTLFDLGAGSCAKAAKLFPVISPRRYVAIDISVDYLRSVLQSLQLEHPAVEMLGLGLDFSSSLALPPGVAVAWPGGQRLFSAGERIHTESSVKWLASDFAALLRDAGFHQPRLWTDEQQWFGVFVASAD